VFTLVAVGCAHSYVAAPPRQAAVGPGPAADAFAALSSPRGPDRFAQVTPLLYRGAQPNAEQLAMLRDVGVKTIVTFITDKSVLRDEIAAAQKLGLTVHSYPFYGMSSPDPALLERIVDELRAADAPVYVHCRQGRDRTSLVVALFRVWVQGWNPKTAWQHEALDFGHGGLRTIFFRRLDSAYVRLTQKS
jgi:protein tyrosine/serine phosphatase